MEIGGTDHQRPGLEVHLAFAHFHQVPSQVGEACRVGDGDAVQLGSGQGSACMHGKWRTVRG